MVLTPPALAWGAAWHEEAILMNYGAVSSKAGVFEVGDRRNAIAGAERVLAALAA